MNPKIQQDRKKLYKIQATTTIFVQQRKPHIHIEILHTICLHFYIHKISDNHFMLCRIL